MNEEKLMVRVITKVLFGTIGIIIMFFTIIYVIVCITVYYGNSKAKIIAEVYLVNMYDFEWDYGHVQWDFFYNSHEIEIIPQNHFNMDCFLIYVRNDKVIADTYVEEYTCRRLKEHLENNIVQIWGEEVEIRIGIKSDSLEAVPLYYSTDSPLSMMVENESYLYQNLLIKSKTNMNEDIMKENIWKTIVYVKSEFPSWETLVYTEPDYIIDGKRKGYKIQNISDVESEEDIENVIKEIKVK